MSPKSWISEHAVLSRARSTLLTQGMGEGLYVAECFQALIKKLPSIMLTQYEYEKVRKVASYQNKDTADTPNLSTAQAYDYNTMKVSPT